MPRREVGAGVEQIAGNIDLLAFGGVGQTLRRRLGMNLDRDDDRHRDSAEHPNKTAMRASVEVDKSWLLQTRERKALSFWC